MSVLANNASPAMLDTFISAMPQLLSVIIGGAIGLTASWATNHASMQRMKLQLADERAKDRKDEKCRHADELYTMFSAWSKMLISHHMLAVSTWTGQIDYASLLDMQKEAIARVRDKYEFERIEMLVHAYFPHLLPEFNQALRARETLAERESRLRSASRTGQFKAQSADSLIAEIESFGDASDKFKDVVIKELAKLDNGKML